MTFYLIVRSHYYGRKSGAWRLLLEDSGEPIRFASRREAIAAINPEGLNHNESGCEIMVLSDGNSAPVRIERRLNARSAKRSL